MDTRDDSVSDTPTDRMTLAAIQGTQDGLHLAAMLREDVRIVDFQEALCGVVRAALAASPLQAAGAAEPVRSAQQVLPAAVNYGSNSDPILSQAHPQPAPAGDAGALADALAKLIPLSEALLAGRQPSADLEEHRALRNFLPTARAALAQGEPK